MQTIRLSKKNQTIRIANNSGSIRLSKENRSVKVVNRKENIRLVHSGKTGPQGPKGEQGEQGLQGVGMPTGGVTGDVLIKASDADYDFKFDNVFDASDKNYEQSFTALSTIVVNHNLNKFPSVMTKDSAGDEVEGEVEHTSKSSLILKFSAPFSGVVSCN